MDISEKKSKYYVLYTVVFFVMFLLVFSWLLFSGRTFLWQIDGWDQFYKGLLYYSDYIRKIIKTLLNEHHLVIHQWDFCIGEGSDVLNTLHYYVMGDPFSFFSFLVPADYMHIFVDAMVCLRLYLSGLFFSLLCFDTGINNKTGVLAGAMSYVFCYWNILNAAKHIYFINVMIYLPLLIMGAESRLKRKRAAYFPVVVALSAISNFYFFFMLVLILLIHSFIRTVYLYHTNIREIVYALLRIGISGLIGVFMAGLSVLPVMNFFLSDARRDIHYYLHILYPLEYYLKLPTHFFEGNSVYWMCTGFSIAAVISLILLFKYPSEKNRYLRTMCIICGIIIIIPVFGQFLNGMSYMSNRWSFAAALLVSYVLAFQWKTLFNIADKDKKILFILHTLFTLYLIISVLMWYISKQHAVELFLFSGFYLFWFWLITHSSRPYFQKYGEALMVVNVIVGILYISMCLFSEWENNYTIQIVKREDISNMLSDSNLDIIRNDTRNSRDLIRYSESDALSNTSILNKMSSTQYYWTLSNPYIGRFKKEINNRERSLYIYSGYDSRTTLLELEGVDYFVGEVDGSNAIPYGYKPIGGVVYKNEIPLSKAYYYENYINDEDWSRMDAIEKQQAMLKAVHLSDLPKYSSAISFKDIKLDITDIPFDVVTSDIGITYDKGCFTVTKEGSIAVLALKNDGMIHSENETYVCLKGLSFEEITDYDMIFGTKSSDPLNLYDKNYFNSLSLKGKLAVFREKLWDKEERTTIGFGSSTGIKSQLDYKEEDAYGDMVRHDFIINLGYSEQPVSFIKVYFSSKGNYSLDSLRVVALSMEDYKNSVNSLRDGCKNNLEFRDDSITGTAELYKPGILCIAVPYSDGWQAEVDGKKTEVLIANDHLIALELDKGNHSIHMTYCRPYQSAGIWMSIFGILCYIVYCFLSHEKKVLV